ncbi:MAG: transcription termination/antitermination protein NusG [Clostridia bacterium]|nr:transcription termination/antitermination protein NusG [Clostridia bacterium]
MADEFKDISLDDIKNEECRWYVVHTYSGYENKVKSTLDNIIETRNIRELIPEVIVPEMNEMTTTKSGVRKEVTSKVFPSYVLVKMVMNDYTWFIVRNVRGVTGFVGPGSKPVPLTEKEILELGVDKYTVNVDYEVGDDVRITDGAFANSTGKVSKVNADKRTVVVTLTAFGRETPVEIDLSSVEKL